MTDLLNDIYTDGCKAKKYRLSDFFNRWWDEYAQHPRTVQGGERYPCVPYSRFGDRHVCLPRLWRSTGNQS